MNLPNYYLNSEILSLFNDVLSTESFLYLEWEDNVNELERVWKETVMAL